MDMDFEFFESAYLIICCLGLLAVLLFFIGVLIELRYKRSQLRIQGIYPPEPFIKRALGEKPGGYLMLMLWLLVLLATVNLTWPLPTFITRMLVPLAILFSIFYKLIPADTPIRVVPHGAFGFVRATRYPDTEFIYAVGMTSMFCPVNVPVEETTWGQIKTLYTE